MGDEGLLVGEAVVRGGQGRSRAGGRGHGWGRGEKGWVGEIKGGEGKGESG